MSFFASLAALVGSKAEIPETALNAVVLVNALAFSACISLATGSISECLDWLDKNS